MRDHISSLMDSEIDANQAIDLIKRVGRDEEAREAWATYHLIGDILRGDATHRKGIQSRIFEKLAEEPVILAPNSKVSRPSPGMRVGVAVAASLVTLSTVVWLARQENNPPAQVVQQQAPEMITAQTPESSPPPAGIQQANLSEYLTAHEDVLRSSGGYRRFAVMNTSASGVNAANR